MKNLVKAFLLSGAILAISCNKDDDSASGPAVNPNLLSTPTTLENSTPLNIPDAIVGTASCGNTASATQVNSAIEIDKEGTIKDPSKVTITLSLTHTWCGDITAELIAPSGEVCALIKRMGSTTDGNCGDSTNLLAANSLIFNASFNTMIDVASLADTGTVPSGNYAPSYGTSTYPAEAIQVSLQDFLMNKNIKGTWKIRVADYGVGDTGILAGWKLAFDPGSVQ